MYWKKYDNSALSIGEVHVWLIDYEILLRSIGEMYSFLSVEEKRIADSFKFNSDRGKYIAFHYAMREILSKYLYATTIKEIEYITNDYGKPFLQNINNENNLKFNLTHSNNLALIAISRDFDLGIDIEFMNKNIELMDVAKYSFSEDEFSELNQKAHKDIYKIFYSIWTRKESFLKLTGKGLSINPKTIEVGSYSDHISIDKSYSETNSTCHMYDIKLPFECCNYISTLSTSEKVKNIYGYTFDV